MIGPGVEVNGYRIERMLGSGGMGVVYEAVQASLERRVALKVLRPELADDDAFAERFRREGRIQASLEHPHVLDVYEVGESEHGLFLAMRLVPGQTLIDLLRNGDLDADRALRLLAQVADALDAAHAAGLVHRDLKPQNVLVGHEGEAYLADFGLTRAGSESTIAGSRPMLGTVAYVAPEVVQGGEPTPAADRYAFAATVFHCLTGDVPFPRGSEAAVLFAHSSEPPPRASAHREELPAALDPLFAHALAKDPDRRPSSAGDLVASAREVLGSQAAELGPPVLGAGAAAAVTIDTPPRAKAAKRQERRWPITAAALGAACVGVLAGILLEGDGETVPEVPVPPVAENAQVLGSTLPVPDRSLNCLGRPGSPDSPSCSIVQSDLGDAQLLVPADGAIVGWSVRGADGELAIDVIRPRGRDTTRVAKSQWESAGNLGPHRYETNLPVEAGDTIGLELGPGATIGVSDTPGATTQRWLEPEGGGYGLPDREEGTGFDYELALRAEFVPGAPVPLHRHLTGKQARSAPDGSVREREKVTIFEPREVLDVELSEVGERVVLDVFRGDRRTLRIFIPGMRPGASATGLETYDYPGEGYGEADIWWVNPNTGRLIFHFYNFSATRVEFAG